MKKLTTTQIVTGLGVVLLIATMLVALFLESQGTEVVTRYHDGSLESITLLDRNGKAHGKRLTYYQDGTLKAEHVFQRGGLVSFRVYWPNGKLMDEAIEGPEYTLIQKSYPENEKP